MANTQSKIDLLEQNSKLVAEISELKKKYTEVEAENVKLRQVIEESTDLKTRLSLTNRKHLPQKISSACSELPVISQSSASTIETYSDEENDIGSVDPNLVQNVISFETDLDNTPKQVVNITSVTSNLSEIEKSSESASSICTETKLLEDREVDEFLVERHNEQISNEIRERNREKKLGSQDFFII
ncbi:hypothetical protein Glove_134g263 [Diversispora epigaea]|uniref:Uncharacterized protein n=1 Tax=Diversispora epigaea TaxID=1348612 RepID=A0A397IWX8_9GLOM|nr:hypothetical protein Glove_134g263 [Diversispora epigaea]